MADERFTLTEGDGLDITTNAGEQTVTLAVDEDIVDHATGGAAGAPIEGNPHNVTAAETGIVAASEIAAGIIEIATTAETAAGSDDTRAVTPAKLAGLTASETAKGIVELATAAEVVTGTDTERAVTPAGLQGKTASETAKGIVELATAAEVVTGTDTERAVTPAGLQGKTASETAKGIIELATDAEVATGTDDARAITPAKLTTWESAVMPFPRNHYAGLTLSYNATDPDADIDIAAGEARDATDAVNIVLSLGITKRLDAAFSEGTGNGGLDTGSIAASTLYFVWLIKRSDTGAVDVLFSTSGSAPTMPGTYDYKRLIGAIKTDSSSDIIRFTQVGTYFAYIGKFSQNPPQDIYDVVMSSNFWKTGTLASVPPNSMADLLGVLENAGGGVDDGRLYMRARPADALQSWTGMDYKVVSSGSFDELALPTRLFVNSAQEIDYACKESAGAAIVIVSVRGFDMLTIKDPV